MYYSIEGKYVLCYIGITQVMIAATSRITMAGCDSLLHRDEERDQQVRARVNIA